MENEFEQLEKMLYSEAEKIRPPADGLRAVIKRLPEIVTNNSHARYSSTRANKGRAFASDIIEIINHTMHNFWKIVLPVGLVVVALIAFKYSDFGAKPQSDIALQPAVEQAQTEPIEFVSAELNAEINALINDEVGDGAIVDSESADEAYTESDSRELASFDNIAYYYE